MSINPRTQRGVDGRMMTTQTVFKQTKKPKSRKVSVLGEARLFKPSSRWRWRLIAWRLRSLRLAFDSDSNQTHLPPSSWMFINIPLISQLPPLSPHHHTHSKPKLDLRRGEWGTQCNTILLPIVKVQWCLVHALVPVIHKKVTTQEHIWKCQRLSCHTGHYQYIHVQMWLWVWQLWILTSGVSAERTFISFCIRCILSLLGL